VGVVAFPPLVRANLGVSDKKTRKGYYFLSETPKARPTG